MLGLFAVFLIIFFIVLVTMTVIIASSFYKHITEEFATVFTIIFSISYAAMATYIIHILGYI